MLKLQLSWSLHSHITKIFVQLNAVYILEWRVKFLFRPFSKNPDTDIMEERFEISLFEIR